MHRRGRAELDKPFDQEDEILLRVLVHQCWEAQRVRQGHRPLACPQGMRVTDRRRLMPATSYVSTLPWLPSRSALQIAMVAISPTCAKKTFASGKTEFNKTSLS